MLEFIRKVIEIEASPIIISVSQEGLVHGLQLRSAVLSIWNQCLDGPREGVQIYQLTATKSLEVAKGRFHPCKLALKIVLELDHEQVILVESLEGACPVFES